MPEMALEASGPDVSCDEPGDPMICYAIYDPGNEKAHEFQLLVNASVLPGGGYASFQAELFFSGLTYNQDDCPDEVLWPDGVAYAACQNGPAGQRILGSATYIVPPGPLSLYTGALVELDVHCASAGSFAPFLSAAPSSTTGSFYGSNVGTPLYLSTTGTVDDIDVDGDTTPDSVDVADELTITCVSPDGDDDNDGCTNLQELGPNPELGGARDPTSFWDFFDVTVGSGNRDRSIDLFIDIFGVGERFGANDAGASEVINRYTDPLSFAPPAPFYHPSYDRSPAPMGADPWDMGPPDGEIDLFIDIFGVAMQFGHSCA